MLATLALALALAATAGASVCESRGPNFGGSNILVLPPPKHLVNTSFSMECKENAPGTVYNNAIYADGSGPRGADNATDCCAQCAVADGCKYWSYNVDPALPNVTQGTCRWGALTWCCFFHSASG